MIKASLDGTPINKLKPGSDKKVLLVCDECGKENSTTYHNYMLAQRNPNRKGETYCKRCASIKSGLAKRGKKLKGGPRPQIWGDKHHSWLGGRFVTSDGYINIHTGSPKKYRKEHLIVVEEFIGRSLLPHEIVHHIDGNKQNNKISNLCLLKDAQQHRQVHINLQRLSMKLVQNGLISFNKESLEYTAVDKLRELLEQPEEVNQQPSFDGNVIEGSTTR